jgi:hypothetical protein
VQRNQKSKEELNEAQERIFTRMKFFNRQTTQYNESKIIKSSSTEAFNQFATSLTITQESMKEFSRM